MRESVAVRHLPFLLALFFLPFSVATSQLLGTEAGAMHYPSPLLPGEIKSALGLTLTKPPPEVVEEFSSVMRAPLFEYRMLYGLPHDVILDARVTTIIVSNQFALGAQWVYPLKPFGFAAGVDLAYWFGKLEIDGFDNFVKGWNIYPSVTAGYDFEKFSLTLKGELDIVLSQSKRVGDIVVSEDAGVFNGGSFSIYLEQPLWKDNYFIIGMKNNIVKFYYVVWPGFPTFDRYTYIPEFYFGFRL
jgi:hypothetical protein